MAIYTRVSTGEQTTANQAAELKGWADGCGHTVVKIYEDKGISGAKGRDKRPAFDAVLKGAVRREFDMLAVWSSDRLGRSLQHLIEVLVRFPALYSSTVSVPIGTGAPLGCTSDKASSYSSSAVPASTVGSERVA